MKHRSYWPISETRDYQIRLRVQICRGKSSSPFEAQVFFFYHLSWRTLHRYTVEWVGREGLDPEAHGEYLQHFITHFYRNIVKLVDRAMRKEDSSAQGQIITEILQHLHACNNSVRVRISQ